MHTISLDDMRLFVAVIEAGSLSQAAILTGVPVSRLSRRLTALETALGTQLINRGKKGVHLHELGENFFLHAKAMLASAQLALDSIHQSLEAPFGLLKISLPVDMVDFIAPKLGSYLEQYPQVHIEVLLSQQKVSMIQDGIDIAIRAGTIDNDNVVAKTLMMLEFGVYATAGYLAKFGTPTHPNELYQHRLINQSLSLPWRFSQKGHQLRITAPALVASNDFVLSQRLIAQGLGIGVLPKSLVDEKILTAVLQDWQLPSTPLSVIYYKNRGNVATVRSFVDWLFVTQAS